MAKPTYGLKKILFLFCLALAGCVVLLLLRYLVTGHGTLFLAWNLVLAIVPMGIAILAGLVLRRDKNALLALFLIFFTFVWLVFFPNSSYIFTDFIHLIQKGLSNDNPNARGLDKMLVWYDVIVRSLFAFAGHFLGLVSLYLMHSLWRKFFGRLLGWIFVILSCLAAAYGVFVGRFLRINSWNLFTHPNSVPSALIGNLGALDAWVFSSAFALFLLISYFFVYLYKAFGWRD